MNKRFMTLILVAVTLSAILILAIAGGRRFPLVNQTVAAVVLPIEEGINTILHGGDSIRDFGRALLFLRNRNEFLEQENRKLREDNVDLVLLRSENKALRNLLEYKKSHKGQKLLAAKVIAGNFGDLRDAVYINVGKTDKIEKDMLVVTEDGIVGLVNDIYDNYARVILISNPECRIGVKVLRTDIKTSGVIHGIHETNNTLLMEHIAREADIKNDDIIVTNGYSGKHPKNIYVGKVLSVQMDAAGLVKEANIDPYVDLDRVEYVFVITDFVDKVNLDTYETGKKL